MLPVWLLLLTIDAGPHVSTPATPVQATTVCISTQLDPLSYRPDPSLATRSPDFLSRIEGEFSRGFVDAVLYAIKRKTGSPSTSDFYWQAFSSVMSSRLGYPPQCDRNAINVHIASHFFPSKAAWSLAIDINHESRAKGFLLSGKDTYVACAEICQTDPLGGMGKAMIDRGGRFLGILQQYRRAHSPRRVVKGHGNGSGIY